MDFRISQLEEGPPVDELLTYLATPPADKSDIPLVKFGILLEPGTGSTAYLFPISVNHDDALASIVASERQNYDVLLDFNGAGALLRDTTQESLLRIGWGSTSSSRRFGGRYLDDVPWANTCLAQLQEKVQERLRNLGFPVDVQVQWVQFPLPTDPPDLTSSEQSPLSI